MASEAWGVVLWSGHGAPGRLMAADGPVSAEWLACMLRQAPSGVVLLSACWSGARDESLHSLAESPSQSSITCIGMWVSVEDRTAVIYDVEFFRAYVRPADTDRARARDRGRRLSVMSS